VAREPLLTATGAFLVHEHESEDDSIRQVVVLRERVLSRLAPDPFVEHLSSGDGRIVILEEAPHPLQRFGILPTPASGFIEDLAAAGAPTTSVDLLPYGDVPLAYNYQNLQGWMDRHAEVRASLICPRLGSRTCRATLDRVLSADAAKRIAVVPEDLIGIDETNWWKSRAGIRVYVGRLVDWVHVAFIGAEALPPNPRSPRTHIRQLLREAP